MRLHLTGTLAIALAVAGAMAVPASAQEGDPDLNEGDLDTSAPPPDESYLDEGSSGDNVTLSEGDLDTSVPPPEDAYLDEGADEIGPPVPETDLRQKRDTPGPAAVLVLAILAGAGVVARRRP